jgi:hypothetical protein
MIVCLLGGLLASFSLLYLQPLWWTITLPATLVIVCIAWNIRAILVETKKELIDFWNKTKTRFWKAIYMFKCIGQCFAGLLIRIIYLIGWIIIAAANLLDYGWWQSKNISLRKFVKALVKFHQEFKSSYLVLFQYTVITCFVAYVLGRLVWWNLYQQSLGTFWDTGKYTWPVFSFLILTFIPTWIFVFAHAVFLISSQELIEKVFEEKGITIKSKGCVMTYLILLLGTILFTAAIIGGILILLYELLRLIVRICAIVYTFVKNPSRECILCGAMSIVCAILVFMLIGYGATIPKEAGVVLGGLLSASLGYVHCRFSPRILAACQKLLEKNNHSQAPNHCPCG